MDSKKSPTRPKGMATLFFLLAVLLFLPFLSDASADESTESQQDEAAQTDGVETQTVETQAPAFTQTQKWAFIELYEWKVGFDLPAGVYKFSPADKNTGHLFVNTGDHGIIRQPFGTETPDSFTFRAHWGDTIHTIGPFNIKLINE